MFPLSHVTVNQLPYLVSIVVLSVTVGAGMATLWWKQPDDPGTGDRHPGQHPKNKDLT